jgi:hypothetical protein
MSTASFYKWRAKYGGMDASVISQMKSLEDENRRLKRIFADLPSVANVANEGFPPILVKPIWSGPVFRACAER